ncbi:hypothetical protein [Brevundimonas sp. FT23042]|uniref:hypothetical protein n=1 Tax=Brevundimonas sp. FT23042 TaxID=3393749 RepID=UPI003B588783
MFKSLLIAGACLSIATSVQAEVRDRGPDHFVLRYEAITDRTPPTLYAAVGAVGLWWDGAHTYSGDARNMTLPLEVGGCFCEQLADGTAFEHGRVVGIDLASGISLDAPLGPLKGKAARADWRIEWSGDGPDRTLVMTYVVQGDGLGVWADGVDGVMSGQFARLVRFIEADGPA